MPFNYDSLFPYWNPNFSVADHSPTKARSLMLCFLFTLSLLVAVFLPLTDTCTVETANCLACTLKINVKSVTLLLVWALLHPVAPGIVQENSEATSKYQFDSLLTLILLACVLPACCTDVLLLTGMVLKMLI